ncbi:MAG: alcohol acetyltransferase [Micrococcaceae bacterium]
MTRHAWVRLDNASNIFLAARSDADPKVFRIFAELDHEVDPELLQDALDEVYDQYPLYHAVLRRGVFWHYLQDSELRPQVTGEDLHTCAPLYQPHRRTLLFRVVHHRRRINLEIFHALSDGTGALWFLTDLVNAYLRRLSESATQGAPEATSPVAVHELAPDSFAEYFRHPAEGTPGERLLETSGETDSSNPRKKRRRDSRRVHRVQGTRTPDHRTRLIELTLSGTELARQSKAEGVSLTMLLIALFFESVRLASSGLGRSRTLSVSVPVNLRQFFPSTSARNFFATVRLEHTYGEGADDLAAIARGLEEQFAVKASASALDTRLRRFVRFERMPLLRVVPRPLKDGLLRLINWKNNRGLTVAISNLGRVVLPAPAESRVGRMGFHVSAVRPQFCAMSHGSQMTVSFTSPFMETDHVREFAQMLTQRGIAVSVAAVRASEEELGDGNRDGLREVSA